MSFNSNARITLTRTNDSAELEYFNESDLHKALDSAQAGDLIVLREGDYTEVSFSIPSDVYIIALPGALIDDQAVLSNSANLIRLANANDQRALKFKGRWESDKLYYPGDVVFYEGSSFVLNEPIFRGLWSPGESYNLYEFVRYDNKSYEKVSDSNPGAEPDASESDWAINDGVYEGPTVDEFHWNEFTKSPEISDYPELFQITFNQQQFNVPSDLQSEAITPSEIELNLRAYDSEKDIHWEVDGSPLPEELNNSSITIAYSDYKNYFESNSQGLSVAAYQEGVSDSVTLFALKEGSDGLSVILENENHTYSRDEQGNIKGEVSSGESSVRVFQGANELNYVPTISQGDLGVYNVTAIDSPHVTDLNIAASNKGAKASPMSFDINSDEAHIDLELEIIGLNGESSTVTKRISYSFADQGVRGPRTDEYIVRPVNGTAIKNGEGQIDLELIQVSGDNITEVPEGGDPQLYYKNDSGVLTSVTNFAGVYSTTRITLDRSHIDSSLTIYAATQAGDILDGVTLADIQDGHGFIGWVDAPNGLTTKAKEDGSFDPQSIELNAHFTYDGQEILDVAANSNIEVVFQGDSDAQGVSVSADGASVTINSVDYFDQNETYTATWDATYTTKSDTEYTFSVTETAVRVFDGQNAKGFSVYANANVFTERKNGSVTPDRIKLSSNQENFTKSLTPTWSSASASVAFEDESGNSLGTTTNADTVYINSSDISASETFTATLNSQYSDSITIARVTEGSDAITALLTNENHTFTSDSSGAVLSYDGSDTEVVVYGGAERYTYDNSNSPGAKTFRIVSLTEAPTDSITPVSDLSNELISVTDFDQSVNAATLDVELEVTGPKGEKNSITKTATYSKSVKGDKGEPGENAVNYYIRPTNGTAIKNNSGTLNIELVKIDGEAESVVSSGDIKLSISDGSGGYSDLSTALGKGDYSAALDSSDISDSIVVYAVDSNDKVYDSVTLVDVEDGQDTTYIEQKFARSTAEPDVNNTNKAPGGAWSDNPVSGNEPLWMIKAVFDADGSLNQNWSDPVRLDGQNGKFYREEFAKTTGLTAPSYNNTGDSPGEAWVDSPDSLNVGAGEYLWVIYRQYTIEKDGTETPETDWSAPTRIKGDSGDNAETLSISADSQIFKIDQDGNETPSVITIRKYIQNSSENVNWFVNGASPANSAITAFENASGGLEITYVESEWANTESISVAAETVSGSLRDETTIGKVLEGSDAFNVFLTNETHTVEAAYDGSNAELENAFTDAKIYRGAVDVSDDFYIKSEVSSGGEEKNLAIIESSTQVGTDFDAVEVAEGLSNNTMYRFYADVTWNETGRWGIRNQNANGDQEVAFSSLNWTGPGSVSLTNAENGPYEIDIFSIGSSEPITWNNIKVKKDNLKTTLASFDNDANVATITVTYKDRGDKYGGVELEKVFSVSKSIAGQAITVQYAPSESGPWDNTFNTDDIYMRQALEGEDTYTEPIRIVGEEGEPGADGKFSNFKFAKNSNPELAPSYNSSQKNPSTNNVEWQDEPPTLSNAEYLWSITANFKSNKDGSVTMLSDAWSEPVRIKAADGQSFLGNVEVSDYTAHKGQDDNSFSPSEIVLVPKFYGNGTELSFSNISTSQPSGGEPGVSVDGQSGRAVINTDSYFESNATYTAEWSASWGDELGNTHTRTISETVYRQIDGKDARDLFVTQSANAFFEREDGTTDPSDYIELTSNAPNLTEKPVWEVLGSADITIEDANGNEIASSASGETENGYNIVRVPSNAFNESFAEIRAKLPNAGYSTTISISKLQESRSGPLLLLSSESYTLPAERIEPESGDTRLINADSNSNGYYDAVAPKISAYYGSELLTYASSSQPRFENAHANGVNINASVYLDDNDDLRVRTSNFSQSNRSAEVNITADIVFPDGTTETLEKEINISKAVEGENAKGISISADSQLFTFNQDEEPKPSEQTITVSAEFENILGDYSWLVVNDQGETIKDVSTGSNRITLTNGTDFTYEDDWLEVQVKSTNTSFADYSDSLRIYKAIDGSSALTGYLTNPTDSVATDRFGKGADFSGSVGTFEVFRGVEHKESEVSEYGIVEGSDNIQNAAGSSDSFFEINEKTGAYSINQAAPQALIDEFNDSSTNYAKVDFYAEYQNNEQDRVVRTFKVTKNRAGQAGAGIVYRGPWDNGDTKYYDTAQRTDIVEHEGRYWMVYIDPLEGVDFKTGSELGAPGSSNIAPSGNYEEFGEEFDSVATKLLLAENATITKILNIGSTEESGAIQSASYNTFTENSPELINPDGSVDFDKMMSSGNTTKFFRMTDSDFQMAGEAMITSGKLGTLEVYESLKIFDDEGDERTTFGQVSNKFSQGQETLIDNAVDPTINNGGSPYTNVSASSGFSGIFGNILASVNARLNNDALNDNKVIEYRFPAGEISEGVPVEISAEVQFNSGVSSSNDGVLIYHSQGTNATSYEGLYPYVEAYLAYTDDSGDEQVVDIGVTHNDYVYNNSNSLNNLKVRSNAKVLGSASIGGDQSNQYFKEKMYDSADTLTHRGVSNVSASSTTLVVKVLLVRHNESDRIGDDIHVEVENIRVSQGKSFIEIGDDDLTIFTGPSRYIRSDGTELHARFGSLTSTSMQIEENLNVKGDSELQGDTIIRGNVTILGDTTISGETNTHIEVDSSPDVLNSEGELLQSISFDAFGHVASVQTTAIDYSSITTGNAEKLDNLDSDQFIRSDIDDTVTGLVTFSNGVRIGSGARLVEDNGNVRIKSDNGSSDAGIIASDLTLTTGNIEKMNVTELDVGENFISVASGQEPPHVDAGIFVRRGSGLDAYNYFNESKERWGSRRGESGDFNLFLQNGDSPSFHNLTVNRHFDLKAGSDLGRIYYHADSGAIRFYSRSSNSNQSVNLQRYDGSNYHKVWDAGNDGYGSGLTASDSKKWESHLFSDYLNQGVRSTDDVTFDTIALNNNESGDISSNGQIAYDQSDGLYLYYGSASVAPVGATGAALIWDSFNQGPGSGMDSDTVDGYQGDDLAVREEDETIEGAWTHNSNLTVNAAILGQKGYFSQALHVEAALKVRDSDQNDVLHVSPSRGLIFDSSSNDAGASFKLASDRSFGIDSRPTTSTQPLFYIRDWGNSSFKIRVTRRAVQVYEQLQALSGIDVTGNVDFSSSGDISSVNNINVSSIDSNNGNEPVDINQRFHFHGQTYFDEQISIGTVSPDASVAVHTKDTISARFRQTADDARSIIRMDAYSSVDNDRRFADVGYDPVGDWLGFKVGSSGGQLLSDSGDLPTLAVTRGGRVGIGTVDPGSQLHVAGDIESERIDLYRSGGRGASLAVYEDSSGQLAINDASGNQAVEFTGRSNSNYVLNGNFGLGTSAPSERLEVDGRIQTAEAIGDFSSGAEYFIGFDNGSATANGSLVISSANYVEFVESAGPSVKGEMSLNNGTFDWYGDLDVGGDFSSYAVTSGERRVITEAPNGIHRRLGNPIVNSATGLSYRVEDNPSSGEPIFQVRSSGEAVRLFVEHDGYTGSTDNAAWFHSGRQHQLKGAGGLYVESEVGIGTSSPQRNLDVSGSGRFSANLRLDSALKFGSDTRQMLDLYGDIYALGVQSSTLYQRTGENFAWFSGGGGQHSDSTFDPGSGGSVLATLSGDGNRPAPGDSAEGFFHVFGVETEEGLYPGGDIVPVYPMQTDIGTLDQKFRSVNAAELNVETLVAREKSTTVDGRFMVGLGNKLEVTAQKNSPLFWLGESNVSPGDWLQLEGSTSGSGPKIEMAQAFASTTAGPYGGYIVVEEIDGEDYVQAGDRIVISGSGPYAGTHEITEVDARSSTNFEVFFPAIDGMSIFDDDPAIQGDVIRFERDVVLENGEEETIYGHPVRRAGDGTPANAWDNGAGVFNTGQIGTGFIDQYAQQSLARVNLLPDGRGSTAHADSVGGSRLDRFATINLAEGRYRLSATAVLDSGASYNIRVLSDDRSGYDEYLVRGSTVEGDISFVFETTKDEAQDMYLYAYGPNGGEVVELQNIHIEPLTGSMVSGPSIDFNVRTGSGPFDIEPRGSLGQLQHKYGFGSSTYGAAFGDPSGSFISMTPDAGASGGVEFWDGGVRMGHFRGRSITLGEDSGTRIEMETQSSPQMNFYDEGVNRLGVGGGTIRVGEASSTHFKATGTKLELNNGGVTFARLEGSELTLGDFDEDNPSYLLINEFEMKFFDSGTERFRATSGEVTVGNLDDKHVTVTDSRLSFHNSNEELAWIASDRIYIGPNFWHNGSNTELSGWGIDSNSIAGPKGNIRLRADAGTGRDEGTLQINTGGSGSDPQYVMVGHTYVGDGWTGNSGISSQDHSGNTLFRLDEGAKEIAGWEFTDSHFYRSTANDTRHALMTMNAERYSDSWSSWPGFSAWDTKHDLMVNVGALYSPNGETEGVFGFALMDYVSNDTYLEFSRDKKQIAGWEFDQRRIYNDNASSDGTNTTFRIKSEGQIHLHRAVGGAGNLHNLYFGDLNSWGGSGWGIRGADQSKRTLFQLSDEGSSISRFTFDHDKLYYQSSSTVVALGENLASKWGDRDNTLIFGEYSPDRPFMGLKNGSGDHIYTQIQDSRPELRVFEGSSSAEIGLGDIGWMSGFSTGDWGIAIKNASGQNVFSQFGDETRLGNLTVEQSAEIQGVVSGARSNFYAGPQVVNLCRSSRFINSDLTDTRYTQYSGVATWSVGDVEQYYGGGEGPDNPGGYEYSDPVGGQNAFRVDHHGDSNYLIHCGDLGQDLRGETLTFSIWLKGETDNSGEQPRVKFGFNGKERTENLSSSWELYSITYTVPSSADNFSASGGDRSWQFIVRYANRGRYYHYAPQVEKGTERTTYQPTRQSLIPTSPLNRSYMQDVMWADRGGFGGDPQDPSVFLTQSGIESSDGAFELGDLNQIAGWEFTTSNFFKQTPGGTVRVGNLGGRKTGIRTRSSEGGYIRLMEDDGALEMLAYAADNNNYVSIGDRFQRNGMGITIRSNGSQVFRTNYAGYALWVGGNTFLDGDITVGSDFSISWDSNITGEGKPESGADVTADNTAASIAGQGDLATKSSVTWGQEIRDENGDLITTLGKDYIATGAITANEIDADSFWTTDATVRNILTLDTGGLLHYNDGTNIFHMAGVMGASYNNHGNRPGLRMYRRGGDDNYPMAMMGDLYKMNGYGLAFHSNYTGTPTTPFYAYRRDSDGAFTGGIAGINFNDSRLWADGEAWTLNKDGSGNLANGSIVWTTDGDLAIKEGLVADAGNKDDATSWLDLSDGTFELANGRFLFREAGIELHSELKIIDLNSTGTGILITTDSGSTTVSLSARGLTFHDAGVDNKDISITTTGVTTAGKNITTSGGDVNLSGVGSGSGKIVNPVENSNPSMSGSVSTYMRVDKNGDKYWVPMYKDSSDGGGSQGNPEVSVSGTSSAAINVTCSYSASASGGSGNYSYSWSFGPSARSESSTGSSASCSWAEGGSQSVTCTVTDGSGNSGIAVAYTTVTDPKGGGGGGDNTFR